jgi:succinate dehydrogenase/fumarate reductase flavoprotein subunit
LPKGYGVSEAVFENFSEGDGEGHAVEVLKTDVLVIGGGGAGLRAALAARDEGLDVALVSKTPIGKSTCTQLSGGAFSVASRSLTREAHYEYSLLTGRGLNQRDFLRALVDEAPERIRELEGFGLKGEWRTGRYTTYGQAPVWGNPIVEVLRDTAQGKGVSLRPWVMVFELLKDGGKIIGALGFHSRTGENIGISARAVVLANGGGGALYPRNDNPVRTTGDGFALAYEAGCALRDMEFVQFIPIGLAEPGKPSNLLAPSLADAGLVLNSQGENILQKYGIFDKPVAVRCRDTFSRAVAFEEREGKEVFLDLTFLAEATWPRDHMASSQRGMLARIYACREKPLRISPTCHFFMGGVATTVEGETGIPGLFAAGEVVGGVHGANRMGGNALSEILVFGYRAGRKAGQFAGNTPGSERDWKRVEEVGREAFEKIRYSSTGTAPRDLRRKFGKTLWEHAGIIRDQRSLRRALKDFAQMEQEEIPAARLSAPKEILEKMEMKGALRVGEMIARSALFREESRGAHYREDFPDADDNRWRGNIFVKNEKGKMGLEFRPCG